MNPAMPTAVFGIVETSILFGAIISGLPLKERLGPGRIVAACTMALGAAVLRLA